MNADTYNKLKSIIAKSLTIPEDKILPDALIIEDLGADSLDVAELVMAINESFCYELTDEEITRIKSVKDVVAILDSKAIQA